MNSYLWMALPSGFGPHLPADSSCKRINGLNDTAHPLSGEHISWSVLTVCLPHDPSARQSVLQAIDPCEFSRTGGSV